MGLDRQADNVFRKRRTNNVLTKETDRQAEQCGQETDRQCVYERDGQAGRHVVMEQTDRQVRIMRKTDRHEVAEEIDRQTETDMADKEGQAK